MRYPKFLRMAALALPAAVLVGGALAQTQPTPDKMTDTAPLPAQDRSSLGAVIQMDQPVLAQRQQMDQALARDEADTRTLGAGPAKAVRKAFTEQESRQRRLDPERMQGTPQ